MSLRENAIGTWELVSYQTKNDKGETIYPLGENATGFIMYTPVMGYMSAQLMKQNRQTYTSGDIHQGTEEEMAEAVAGYMAYSGHFEVDEEAGHFHSLYGCFDESRLVRPKSTSRCFSRWRQRVVIVTGGSQGIGKAMTEVFVKNGDQVIITGCTQ